MEELTLFNATTANQVVELIGEGKRIEEREAFLAFTPLLKAIIDNRIEVARELVLRGANINHRDIDNNDSFYYAAKIDDIEFFNFLLEKTNGKIQGNTIYRCLDLSCEFGYCDVFDALIGKVPEVNGNFLTLACYYGQIDIVDRLLALGVNVNDGIRGETDSSLINSCLGHNNTLAVMDRLICFGADFNFQGEDYDTPLITAVKLSNNDAAKRLIEVGCDLNLRNNKGNTALIIALLNQNVEGAKLVVEAGADQEIMNENGKKAIDYARTMKMKNLFK